MNEDYQDEMEATDEIEEAEEITTPPQSTFTVPPAIVGTIAPVATERQGFSFGELAQAIVPKQAPVNDLADLFEVPQETDNDMYVDDLFEVDDEEDMDFDDDMSDLFTVTREDMIGRTPKRKPVRYQRTNRPYNDNYPRMGGMR